MKAPRLVALSLLLTTSLPAFSGTVKDLEIIINQSSLVVATCESRTCTLAPRLGVTSQDFELEVFWMKRHLDDLGVSLKEDRDGVFRQE